MTKSAPTCFVISPIGSEGSDVRRRADQILRHVITPAVSALNFEAVRADQIAEPGMITTQVIQRIVDAPLVVADLTGSNANVFYELAIRHAIRKPLVQIIQKDDKIPFDVAGMRTIPVDHRDLDSVQEAINEIQVQARSVIGKDPEAIESPISVSLELQALRQSENPEKRSIAEFVSILTELHSGVASLELRLSKPEKLLPPSYIAEVLAMSNKHLHHSNEVLQDVRMHLDRLTHLATSGDFPKKELAKEIERINDMVTFMIRERG
jgi:hypothetical protein